MGGYLLLPLSSRSGNAMASEGNGIVPADSGSGELLHDLGGREHPRGVEKGDAETAGRNAQRKREGERSRVRGKDTAGDRPPIVTTDDLFESKRAGGITPPCDDHTEHVAPRFWDHLTRCKYKTGQERSPCELTITRIPGGYQCVLKEHDFAEQKTFAFLTLLDLAESAERALNDPLIPWKAFESYKNPKGIKKFEDKSVDKDKKEK